MYKCCIINIKDRLGCLFLMMSEDKVPKMQRALVLQGGGALGAYNTGVFQALYERIDAEKMVDSYLM
jgi:hypothetical protein